MCTLATWVPVILFLIIFMTHASQVLDPDVVLVVFFGGIGQQEQVDVVEPAVSLCGLDTDACFSQTHLSQDIILAFRLQVSFEC